MRTSAGFLEIGLSGNMRIQIRPPRLMWRVIARRAASICRAVKRPRATAFRPNSPKLTLLPRVAMPVLRPFCSLRYFLLAGCSMLCSRLSYLLFRLSGDWCSNFLIRDVALEHPNLYTDDAISGFCFGGAVVDIGSQRMQWHTAFAIPLGTGDLNAVQATRTHDLDTLRTEAHRILHCTLHRAAEHDALFQLRGDAVGDQLRVDFRLAHLFNGNIDRLQPHALAQFGSQRLDILAFLADHHAWTSRVDRHLGVLGRALDNHLGYAGRCQFLFQESSNFNIPEQQTGKILAICKPLGVPIFSNAQPETGWMNFLSHNLPLAPDADRYVASLLLKTIALPLGFGDKAPSGCSLINVNSFHFQFIDISSVVMLSIRNRRLKRLLDDASSLLRAEVQNVKRLRDRQTANLISHQAAFLRGEMNSSCNCSSRCHDFPLFLDHCFFVSRVALEGARQRKFTQLMANHVFRYIHRNVLLAVMHRNCQTDELRQHR